ncbi:RICIN domain-containing protein [Kitasatospora sp. NPDC056184]|uniref:RICIN domain-containing protein n=1 Tax=Kitasatospora sp. NPDC056184 TaxID=3345738 RepID=UPI0035DAA239
MTARPNAARRLSVAVAVALGAAGALVAPASAAGYPTPYYTNFESEIKASHSGKCLEIADWRTDDGAPARQWTCTGGDNQKWRFNADGTIVNLHSGKCLEDPGWNTAPPVQVGQWACHGGLNQQWYWSGRKTDVNPNTLFNLHAGLNVDISGNSKDDGAAAILWHAVGWWPTPDQMNQYFYLTLPKGPTSS